MILAKGIRVKFKLSFASYQCDKCGYRKSFSSLYKWFIKAYELNDYFGVLSSYAFGTEERDRIWINVCPRCAKTSKDAVNYINEVYGESLMVLPRFFKKIAMEKVIVKKEYFSPSPIYKPESEFVLISGDGRGRPFDIYRLGKRKLIL